MICLKEIEMTRILTIIALMFATPVLAEYDIPDYIIVLQEGDLAIRDYAPVMVVETQVTASRRDAPGDAFRKLARYIGGKNKADLDIPMTAPVAQTQASPSGTNEAEKWSIQFFLPRDLTATNTPPAIEEGVNVRLLEAQTYMVDANYTDSGATEYVGQVAYTDDEYAEENGDVEITDHLREDEGEVSPMKDYKDNVLTER